MKSSLNIRRIWRHSERKGRSTVEVESFQRRQVFQTFASFHLVSKEFAQHPNSPFEGGEGDVIGDTWNDNLPKHP
ncbi:MAG: hypothetical protein R3E32_03870 [Chitinophagales bacterium]